ncbi:hypothetical protein IPM65_07000 [Candidatus Roizmanbacteria bacterium]|nr:MAG: hypothetical protein IPM65_07000 [Candidatus Roizmanbacteria bacterium]
MFFNRSKSYKSELFNEKTFYEKFLKDLELAKKEVVIESPYITANRMETFNHVFQRILNKKIKIHLITRDPVEHDDEYLKHQAVNEILRCKELGMQLTLLNGYHHRKLAFIDRKILWEGSLNILSYNKSLEIMRRIEDESSVRQMLRFIKL